MTDHDPHGVRVTNADIYKMLLEVNGRVSSVQQTMDQVVMPTLQSHALSLDGKADREVTKAALESTNSRLGTIEARVYAIGSGIVAAALGAKGLGIL